MFKIAHILREINGRLMNWVAVRFELSKMQNKKRASKQKAPTGPRRARPDDKLRPVSKRHPLPI
jgi:hypothetical protein